MLDVYRRDKERKLIKQEHGHSRSRSRERHRQSERKEERARIKKERSPEPCKQTQRSNFEDDFRMIC